MMRIITASLAVLAIATAAQAESELEQGFAGALRGCEAWIFNPASWVDGPEPFIAEVGLGDKMMVVESVDEISLPPPELRRANHFWRINSTDTAGFVLVVSDQLPMCHITGGGNADLQPAVESVLEAEHFTSRWEQVGQNTNGDMISTEFRARSDPAFSLMVSRANMPGQRLDRVQVIATAILSIN